MEPFTARLSVAERAEACAVRVAPRREGAAVLREAGITVAAFWHTGALSPLAVLSLATAGAGPLAVLHAPEEAAAVAAVEAAAEGGEAAEEAAPVAAAASAGAAALSSLHAECLAACKTAVLAAPHAPGRELHLIALPGGAPVFWCALARRGATHTHATRARTNNTHENTHAHHAQPCAFPAPAPARPLLPPAHSPPTHAPLTRPPVRVVPTGSLTLFRAPPRAITLRSRPSACLSSWI
jgi:hypothetical protein